MPRFSRRWGVPFSRQQLEQRPRCGHRPGNAVPCINRLEGWIRNVAARAPIWGDLDIDAFCKATGYSREHTMRQLSKLRAQCKDLAFETKMRRKQGRKRWGVIVAEQKNLRFDRCSLFYDHYGRRLHNYTTLGKGGFKITPTQEVEKLVSGSQTVSAKEGAREHSSVSSNVSRLCDIPFSRKDSFGIQQFKSYGAGRDMERGWEAGSPISLCLRLKPLRRKAFALMKRLSEEHWDNCKVIFSRSTAFCYAWGALLDGHDMSRIVSCYARSLFTCHGLATDMGGRIGKPVFFNLSSTVAKSRQMLNADGVTPAIRVARWYENHTGIAQLRVRLK